MNEIFDKKLSLTTSSVIHVGTISTSNLNETISIVIPLSTKLATFTEKIQDSYKNDNSEKCRKQCKNMLEIGLEDDKTKGCPFANCSRYGRAFSRSHDLKRHIARHKIRRELLPELNKSEICDCSECEINFIVDYLNSQDHQAKEKEKDTGSKELSTNDLHTPFSAPDNNSKHLQIEPFEKSKSSEDIQQNEDDIIKGCLEIKNKSSNSSILPKGTENITSDKSIEANKLRCNYCLKIFKTKWTLSSHVAAHEGRYHFNCDQCGKKFVRKSHFEGHMRSHETTRPYICDECGKTFKELKHRREHSKRKHPEIMNSTDVQNFFKRINLSIPDETNCVEADLLKTLLPINIHI